MASLNSAPSWGWSRNQSNATCPWTRSKAGSPVRTAPTRSVSARMWNGEPTIGAQARSDTGASLRSMSDSSVAPKRRLSSSSNTSASASARSTR
jgi:hypothetical protein